MYRILEHDSSADTKLLPVLCSILSLVTAYKDLRDFSSLSQPQVAGSGELKVESNLVALGVQVKFGQFECNSSVLRYAPSGLFQQPMRPDMKSK